MENKKNISYDNQTKALRDMLIEDKKKEQGSNKNRALFLARKEEIQQLLSEGWTAKEIWKSLHSRELFHATYDSFVRLVRRHIKQKEPTKEELQPQTQIVPVPTEAPKAKTIPSSAPSGFNYNPQPLDLNDL